MHDTLLMIFTGVLAVAVLMQSLLFFGIYRSVRKMTVWMDSLGKDLLRNVEAVSAKVDDGLTTIKGIAEGLKPIAEKLTDATEIVYKRIAELDNFLAEATSTARLEILRIQDTIQIASRRTQETIDLLLKNILAPLNELSAITRAIRIGLDVLFRRRKNPSDTSAQDEAMFI
jgi:hypothetical protein